ncbi:MAG: hypothetical protein WA964_01955 [Ilumatobacter sp.]|uniref:hypothetical protein n=1 Tax=Ilumatobacter sp. TaxID=1967498 RepID=UPI003C75EBE3
MQGASSASHRVTSVLRSGGLDDSDTSHGWKSYRTDADNPVRARRSAARDFWVD